MSILLFAVAPTSTSMPDDPMDGIPTSFPVESLGITTVTTDQGALRLEPGKDLSGIFLVADSVAVETEWQTGASVDSGDFPIRMRTDDGSQRSTTRDAQVLFQPFQDEPLFVPFDQGAAMTLSLTSSQGVPSIPDEDPLTASVGSSPDAVGAGGESPRIVFWYTQEGPTV